MDASVRFDTQIIGALPVIVDYFEQLQLSAIINEIVPWEGRVPLGTVVEIMIANRLLHPEALYRRVGAKGRLDRLLRGDGRAAQ